MAKTFSQLKTNVGNMLQDTSGATATLIGVWINNAYQDAWARCMWTDLIDDNFTFESVVDQAEYSLESDFGEEVACVDIANGHRLKRIQIKEWWDKYANKYNNDSLDSGNPIRYIILEESNKIKLDPPPDTAETYAFPYKKTITSLSADSDTSAIRDLDMYLEYYAIGMGFAYKRKFAVSTEWNNRAEFELAKRVKQEKIKINQRYQIVPAGNAMTRIFRLLGDQSYDSI